MTGFITMQREARNHPLFKGNPERFYAWFWMLSEACWKPSTFDIKGKTITLKRGQFCASIRHLGDAWGMSKSAVDRFLTRLETETMIEREAGQGRCIITICNYDKYQSGETGRRDNSGTATGTAAGQQRDTKEQGNKGTSDTDVSQRAQKRGGGKSLIPKDWVRPDKADLPPKARALAEQWTDASYDTHAEAFHGYWLSRRQMNADWRLTWANRIVSIHSQVMRDQKYGNAPKPEPAKQPARNPAEWLAFCEAKVRELRGQGFPAGIIEEWQERERQAREQCGVVVPFRAANGDR